jgi:flagellar biosynthesis protein FlhG
MKEPRGQSKVIRFEDCLNGKTKPISFDLNKKKRVIAITSGKGGVGKTNIVANLGFTLSKIGKKVLILDADLGLGNLDVLLGLTPQHNLSHVIAGEKRLGDILETGPGGIQILPASSGIQNLTALSQEQKDNLLDQLDSLVASVDILLIDTAAGISSNVLYFTASAHEILVAVTPEPTSITDAYALMKVLSLNYSESAFRLVVNQAATVQEAQQVVNHLRLVANRFLNISIDYLGSVLYDKTVAHSVRQQRLVSEFYPESIAGKCFSNLARNLSKPLSESILANKEKSFAKSFLSFSTDTP